MTAQETSLLIGAIVGLMGALQAWLTVRSVAHGKQLNGLMAPRIAKGAAEMVLADRAEQQAHPTLDTAAAKAAHVAALRAELAHLES
jgi:hypothetical protein